MQLEVFYKKGALENFAKFSGKHLCQSLFFNKVAGLRPVLQNSSGLVLFLIVSIFVYVLHVNVLTWVYYFKLISDIFTVSNRLEK